MKKISVALARIANWKTMLFFLALYILFVGYILQKAEIKMNELAGQTVGVIDLQMGYNPQKTLDMVAAYGDEGRAFYARTEQTADFAYPLVYAFLFSIILSILYRNKSMIWVNLLPFFCLLFDYCENIFILSLLHNYPQQSMSTAQWCDLFKLIKWIVFASIVLLIVIGLFSKIFSRNRPQTV